MQDQIFELGCRDDEESILNFFRKKKFELDVLDLRAFLEDCRAT